MAAWISKITLTHSLTDFFIYQAGSSVMESVFEGHRKLNEDVIQNESLESFFFIAHEKKKKKRHDHYQVENFNTHSFQKEVHRS